jgi:hypothetical protein
MLFHNSTAFFKSIIKERYVMFFIFAAKSRIAVILHLYLLPYHAPPAISDERDTFCYDKR